MKKSKRMTAGEYLAQRQADPDWAAAKAERERARQQQAAEYLKAEAPVVHDLNEAGLAVKSVWDLVNRKAPYPAAIPILLGHLNRSYPDRVREGIARALAVPEAHVGWGTLLEAFRQEKDPTTVGVKWALACALGAAGTDRELDEVLSLLEDVNLGGNRGPLLHVLARSQDDRSGVALEKLRGDKSVAEEAQKALRRFRYKKKLRT